MIAILLIGLFVVLLFGVPIAIGITFWNKSFIHTVHVAIQTGSDPSDVVWKQDKFKVINKNGYNTIVFKWMRGQSSQSFDGNLWTKFVKQPNLTVTFKDDGGTDLWNKKGISNMVQRGLYLYRSVEGQFYPMQIAKTAEGMRFRVLSNDNRAHILNMDRDVHNLTMTSRKQLMAVAIVAISLLVLGVGFILFLVYMGENVAKFCQVAPAAANSLLDGVQAVVGG